MREAWGEDRETILERSTQFCLGRLWSHGVALAVLFLCPMPALAGATQCSPGGAIAIEGLQFGPTRAANCNDGVRTRVFEPLHSGPNYELRPPGCDPNAGTCGVAAVVHTIVPGHGQNPIPSGFSVVTLFWFDDVGTTINTCGLSGVAIVEGEFDAFHSVASSLSCSGGYTGIEGDFVYRSRISGCTIPLPPFPPGSRGPFQVDTPYRLSAPVIEAKFCGTPAPPPPAGCNGGASCRECPAGGAGADPATESTPESAATGPDSGGLSVGGGGAGWTAPDFPGVRLRYLAGGAGATGTPGSTSWRTALGRHWSHEFAERIIEDPDESHVWLITKYGTFREYSDLEAGSGLRRYQAVAPSDEHRQLWYDTATGRWELRGLVGQVSEFDDSGRWSAFRDRNGNEWTGFYGAGGHLDSVTFPDEETETFAYSPSGRLISITRVGADIEPPSPPPTRTWTLLWAGDDLVRIEYPDGTARNLSYNNIFGYLDRVVLQQAISPGDLPKRIERRWEYDDFGNAIRTWRGAEDSSDASAVAKWELEFDDPADPTETTVTDPLGGETVYVFDRDPDGTGKPRVLSVSGPCPGCGTGPDTTYDYDDVNHPLMPTTVTDGDGTETEFTYDSNGRVESKTEAANVVSHPHLPRFSEWQYDANFPGYPTLIEGPTAVGDTHTRTVTMVYDTTTGDLESRTIGGEEATYGSGTFSLTTTYDSYNSAGGVGTIDPPGYTTTDQITFTYTANGLLVETKTDPVGTTIYTYDGFRRRVRVEDPNGAVTDTQYDALDRPTLVTRRESDGSGTVDPDDPPSGTDLATRYFYSTLGDLYCVKSPNGAGTLYLYDNAGRLTEMQRGTAVASPNPSANPPTCLVTNELRERSLYLLDDAGHRMEEKLQSTTTSSFPNSATTFDRWTKWEYSTMCHLDSKTDVIAVDGGGSITDSAVTEYAYTCAGDLEKVWDANHPSGSFPTQPSTLFQYDALHRLTSATQPWGPTASSCDPTDPTDADCLTVSYEYDVQDHLVEVTDGEGTETFYFYSDRDLMTSQTSEVSGTATYTYNDHGELVSETDARSVTVTRTVDAADRVTFVDYPTNSLDVTYAWGTSAAACEIGRLTGITRNSETIDYAYDCFGRMEQDGDLAYTYNADGDRTTLTYPGSLVATYTYDRMNRPISLSIQEGAGSPQTVVVSNSAATYKPFGPLASLRFDLTTDRDETRAYDKRYAPTSLTVSGNLFAWTYSTDDLGNITSIGQSQPTSVSRSYGYQDWQYYLTCAAGPWIGAAASCNPQSGSPRLWGYDRAGNRLSATAGGAKIYTYEGNVASTGNTSELDQITPALSSFYEDYDFDAAGYLAQFANFNGLTPLNEVDYTFDDAGQLSFFDHDANKDRSLRYDGRGFLSVVADAPGTDVFLESTYSSEGVLHSLLREPNSLTPTRINVLYFAGRPIAIWKKVGTGTATLTRIVTDHLGTPVASIQQAGTAVDWYGGFEPFGEDWQAGTLQDSLTKGIFLRMPGQWKDPLWSDATYPMEIFYNVHRWYEPGTGRYTAVDPARSDSEASPYFYADARPTRFTDRLGLFSVDDSCVCPPDDRLDKEELSNEVTSWCGRLDAGITDAKLRRCLNKSCDRGKILCRDDCAPTEGGYNIQRSIGSYQIVNRKATICRNNLLSPKPTPGYLGDAVIHEWAHGCRWQHGQGRGVPRDPGPDQ